MKICLKKKRKKEVDPLLQDSFLTTSSLPSGCAYQIQFSEVSHVSNCNPITEISLEAYV